jgi:phage shock protein C
MSTRTRRTTRPDEADREDYAYESTYGLDDDITDADIEDFLRRDEPEQKPGFFNLPTLAGLSTIGVGVAYLLQELGLFASGYDFSHIIGPWLIGVLIILVGFGVLSWSPGRRRRRAAAREAARERQRARQRERAGRASTREERFQERMASWTERRRSFTKSRTNRKIAGVCGGIGEYFGIDPTIVRIAFVVALIASGTMAVPLYLLLAWVMPHPDKVRPAPRPDDALSDDARVIVIRDR